LPPAFLLTSVTHADFNNVKAQHAASVPASVLKDVTDFAGWHVRDNTRIENAKDKSL